MNEEEEEEEEEGRERCKCDVLCERESCAGRNLLFPLVRVRYEDVKDDGEVGPKGN